MKWIKDHLAIASIVVLAAMVGIAGAVVGNDSPSMNRAFASSPAPGSIERATGVNDTWQSIAAELAPNASTQARTAFARLLACRNSNDTDCDNDSLTTKLPHDMLFRYLPSDVPGATTTTTIGATTSTTNPTTTSTAVTTTTTAPVTSTTTTSVPSTSTTVRATTTTMAPMNMMPVVDQSKIPGRGPLVWTQPYIVAQQYPFQQSDGTGAFRITTRYSNMGYADPIVFPNGVSPHLHVFFGNECITPQTTDPTTCNATNSDGGTLNKTGYWVPAMIDANGAPVLPADMHVYYKTGYSGTDPHKVQNFPKGLRIVAGNPKSTTPESDQVVRFQCDNSGGASFDHIPTNAEGNAGGCAPDTWLVMEVTFPQCWDGVNLDSPDHASHMAYPIAPNGCPASHPVILPEITERALYTVPAGGMPSGWRLSSDNYAFNGGNAGYSAHADWMGGWDTTTFAKVVANCYGNPTGAPKDCAMDLLGNGEQLGFGPH